MTKVWLSGDVRVDASRNLVVLYARKSGTNRTATKTKLMPRQWDKAAMERVTDIVVKSVDRTDDVEPWKVPPDVPKDDILWKQFQEIKCDDVKVEGNPFESLLNLGESKEWSEESWNRLRSQRLPENETQLTFIEKIRETIGKKLVSQGGNWRET